MKTCYRCKEEKELFEFHEDIRSSDGKYYTCKSCKREYDRSEKTKRSSYREMAKTRTSKICPWCKAEKSIDQYYKNKLRVDGLTNYCKDCFKSTSKERRMRTGDSKNKLDRDIKKLSLINTLGGACTNCGLTPSDDWPLACFDFHHRENKTESLGKLLQLKSGDAFARASEEIKKCIVLCRNCHAKHHSNESRSKFEGLVVSPFQGNGVSSKP